MTEPAAQAETKAKELSTVDAALAALASEFNTTASIGPSKTLNRVSMNDVVYDSAADRVTGDLVIEGNAEGLHGEDWDTRQVFRVSQDDMANIALASPTFGLALKEMAQELCQRAQTERAAIKAARDAWCAAGLPISASLSVKRPLRFKGRD